MATLLAMLVKRLVLAVFLGAAAGCAAAHDLTVRECQEGGDFIKNAALSRDNGMTREVFLERLEGDLVMVRAHPPHLRWFVQDEDDEALLVQAARTVFDAPREPSIHQSEFLARCAGRVVRGPGEQVRTQSFSGFAADFRKNPLQALTIGVVGHAGFGAPI
jgi:hypothetical protein